MSFAYDTKIVPNQDGEAVQMLQNVVHCHIIYPLQDSEKMENW